ncbi:hypothetical protein Tco_1467418 [Tanacetum coccineum]
MDVDDEAPNLVDLYMRDVCGGGKGKDFKLAFGWIIIRDKDAAWFKEKVLLVQAQAEAFQTDDLDVYDSDYDDISSAKAVLMANLLSCDSDVLSKDKANNENKIVNESLTVELERYKERVKILEQRFNVDLSSHEKFIDSQMDDMIRMKNTKFAAFKMEIDTLKQTLSKHVKENES